MDFEIYGVAIIPVIIALVELAKILKLPTKYLPILALVLGIVAAIVYIDPGDFRKATFDGIVIGLSASGLYSGTKHMTTEFKNGKNGNGNGNGNAGH